MDTVRIEEYRESYLGEIKLLTSKDMNYIPEISQMYHGIHI